jgi:hypothetical protein
MCALGIVLKAGDASVAGVQKAPNTAGRLGTNLLGADKGAY